MNTAKMIRTLEQLCDSMANSKAGFGMHKVRMMDKSYRWLCRFYYENKYGGSVDYDCSDASLDRALAGLIDKLDAAGLLGAE